MNLMTELQKFYTPEIGGTVTCIDDDSQDEDLGMSGIVLKGTRGLVVGRDYTIKSIDTRNVPSQHRPSMIQGDNPVKVWSDEDYPKIAWGWTKCWIEGDGFVGPMFLSHFKPKK